MLRELTATPARRAELAVRAAPSPLARSATHKVPAPRLGVVLGVSPSLSPAVAAAPRPPAPMPLPQALMWASMAPAALTGVAAMSDQPVWALLPAGGALLMWLVAATNRRPTTDGDGTRDIATRDIATQPPTSHVSTLRRPPSRRAITQ